MQVLYKSRCDNKLAEITERAAADKREVSFVSAIKLNDQCGHIFSCILLQLVIDTHNLMCIVVRKQCFS